RPLQVFDARADRNRASESCAALRQAGEAWQLAEREVYLSRGSPEAIAPDRRDEVRRQVLFSHHLEKRAPRIRIGDDTSRADLFAVLQHDASSATAFDEDLRNRCLGADLRTEGPRRAGDCLAQRAVAAFRETPGAEYAIELAHVVMQQNERGAGRARSGERADDPARGLGRLQRLAFEPSVEVIGGAHRQ